MKIIKTIFESFTSVFGSLKEVFFTPKFYDKEEIKEKLREARNRLDKNKLKIARDENTPAEKLDEILLNSTPEIRTVVYSRKDFKKIKGLLKNLNKEEVDFYETSKMIMIKEEVEYIYILNRIFKVGLFIVPLVLVLEEYNFLPETVNWKIVGINFFILYFIMMTISIITGWVMRLNTNKSLKTKRK